MLAELAAAAAAVGSGGGEDVNAWLRSLGSFAAAGGIGYLAWKREASRADRAESRADSERARADALVDRVVDDVVPALERQSASQREFIEAARELRLAAQYGGRYPTARSGPDQA